MKFYCSKENMSADIAEVIRAFDPRAFEKEGGGEVRLAFSREENSAVILLTYTLSGENPEYTFEKRVNLEQFSCEEEEKRILKRMAKIMVYDLMEKIYGFTLPYGSLTGVRPTKLFRDTKDAGADALDYFVNTLRVSKDKAKLIASVCAAQEGIVTKDGKYIDLFVNIPFCTTRCSYCSFISAEIGRVKKLIPDYVELTEFTVEAGRPDTITEEKLKIMDDMGVTRISVNPQSLNDKTIALIGRKHTAADFFAPYEAAKKYPFDINCDLIAGLPGEGKEDFARTADGIFALRPQNVTVHTLALKKGSGLKLAGYDNVSSATGGMVDYARALAAERGYIPYYMYRQKYMSGNLENVGYCLPGKQCIYNIDIMEECASVIACGAGGISKLYVPEENRLERLADPKGIDVYLQRGEALIRAKADFFPDLTR